MNDFTKGEWGIDLYGKSKTGKLSVGPIGYPDGVAQINVTAPPSEQLRNAHLIASAPAMYKALKTVSECNSCMGCRAVANKALSLARGGSGGE